MLSAIRAQGTPRRYKRGAALFLEGEIADRVFLVESGWVTLRTSGPEGDEMILGLRGPGQVVGEMSALDGAPRSATAIAVDDVETTVIAASSLSALIDSDAAIAGDLLRMLAQRLRDAGSDRFEFMALDALARVARRLLDLADRFGSPDDDGGTRVELPLSQEELASWIGASREATVKALRTLREIGAVTTGRRVVTIVDRPALTRVARRDTVA
jgi:CRP/FNR family transcriptional regulator, cyclic AMP receptor protein